MAETPGDPQLHFIQWSPGTAERILDVWYLDAWNMQTYGPFHIEKAFPVAPADRIVIDYGLNIPTPVDQPITLTFRILSGNRPIGPYAGGAVEFRFTDRTQVPPLTPLSLPDTGWFVPPDGYSRFGSIVGEEKVNPPEFEFLWENIEVGPYIKFTEHLRLKYVDSCNQEQIIELGSFDLQRVKVDETYWMVTLQ